MTTYEETVTKEEPTPWLKMTLAIVAIAIIGWAVLTFAPLPANSQPSANTGAVVEHCATEYAAVMLAQKQHNMAALSTANFAFLKCSQEAGK